MLGSLVGCEKVKANVDPSGDHAGLYASTPSGGVISWVRLLPSSPIARIAGPAVKAIVPAIGPGASGHDAGVRGCAGVGVAAEGVFDAVGAPHDIKSRPSS